MTSTAITGITELVTNDPTTGEGALGILHDAALVLEDERVAWVGPRADCPPADRGRDLGERSVVPGFVDAHTHLIFAGDRCHEFVARLTGQPYDGRGISETVDATHDASDDDLRALLRARVAELRGQGTTTWEIKSGYGLNTRDETRLLRLAGEFTTETTYLGGHAVPAALRDHREAYVDLVVGPMLEACAPLARWVDVFCEPASPVAFDGEESRIILEAGIRAGLAPRVHGNQLGEGPGARLSVEVGAASLDHATYLSDEDVDLLADAAPEGGPVVTFLPLVEYATGHAFPDARRVLDRGVTVALASDCNPGTNASSSLPLAMSLAVRHMGMTPHEALWSATAGGAAALRRTDVGRLVPGARADLAVIDAPTFLHLFYRPGVPLVRALDDDHFAC